MLDSEAANGAESGAVSPRARAEAGQRKASDPAVSAFVSASAGSGKTKLLTDRLLRLMLSGARPERIQCLTFTKAAAEMALRLQHRLGQWVTMPPERLDAELRGLQVEPNEESRRHARALFAHVLDLPGGMRIGTIHAFCQSLLRRFPLEASLSPHFQLVEEADATQALNEAREAMLAGADASTRVRLKPLAGLTTADGFGSLIAKLSASAARQGDPLEAVLLLGADGVEAALRRILGLTVTDEATLLQQAVSEVAPHLRASLQLAAEHGSPAVRDRASMMLDWLAVPPEARIKFWSHWLGFLLTGEGKPRAASVFCNKKLMDQSPHIADHVRTEQERVLQVEDTRKALRVAEATAALLILSVPILSDYRERKQRSGLLDYDDLIGRTENDLLREPGAAWVLYKLDGGLDHLLLDEVQDTADPQWKIADSLTAEFFAGTGAQDQNRTFFAVGDPKQSIYSFQGAEPDAFEHWRRHLRNRANQAGLPWVDVPLDVSFRSTAPVLALVDSVFADPAAAAGVVEDAVLQHYPNRAGHAGMVELWPLTPPPDETPPEPWTIPDRNMGLSSAPQLLADTLAKWIAEQIERGTVLESRARPLRPGDVLVLVRRRGQFDRALVRALKSCGVPVAGLDRMRLTEQPAVQDLLALLEVLLLPGDDLRLAELLVSPLGGVSDESLMELAMNRAGDRPGSLWAALRERSAEQADWSSAYHFLTTLRARADYASPHALLVEALGRLGGRAKLFARLGPEAAEPVDELLAAALRYSRAHPPSLQGFLHWLRQSGAEVKREAEGAAQHEAGQVRIMTVHGAKGLQAPLVILPDTTALPPDDGPLVWVTDPQNGIPLPLWSPRQELRCSAVDQARQQGKARRLAEYNRLLYVALTRAEDRLLVCGWQPRRGADDASWYRLVQRGFQRLATEEEAFSGRWDGTILRHASPQTVPPQTAKAIAATPDISALLPAWIGTAPEWQPTKLPEEPPLPRPLAPSRPEGVEWGPEPQAASPGRAGRSRALRTGQLVHSLLQHLPDLPDNQRAATATRYLSRPGHGLDDDKIALLMQEVLAVLRHPELAPVFAPDSRAEAPLSGLINGKIVNGVIDRLSIRNDGIWFADFKTNRDPPDSVEQTPVTYLRQMAAYRSVLQCIYPTKPIRAALVWTQNARAVMLPDALLDQHAPSSSPGSTPEPINEAKE